MTNSVATPKNLLPKVAIITPVYNGVEFLRETLDNVQDQDYPNLVHVILDNCSTDGTAELLAGYHARNVPIILHRNEEVLPLYSNWNTAMNLAPDDAKYVRLLCADDTMSETCTQKMVEVAELDDDVLLVGTNVSKNDDPVPFVWPEDLTIMDGNEVVRRFFLNKMGFFAVHMLMRRDVMDWRNPVYDDRFTGADFESVLAILKRGKFGMVHERLGWVRIHDGSQTAATIVKKNTHFVDWLNTLYEHGPDVLSEKEFKQVSTRYCRHYFRKALRWKKEYGQEAAARHFSALEQKRGPTHLTTYADAWLDWLLIRLGFRHYWSGWPN
ncbi:glycosyltransferase family A protein [Hyphomonas sp.]|jgi:glycosyltransferase involved in cell wall biosynthesis|uniref:glycosyltransferase family 2 protein n=1 Tax=Hyphomonas sp. TaxID=87 RepID=UPI0032D90D42